MPFVPFSEVQINIFLGKSINGKGRQDFSQRSQSHQAFSMLVLI